MAGVVTDHPDDTLTTDDLAFVTNLLDAGSHLHGSFLGCPFGFPGTFLVRDSRDLTPMGVVLGETEEDVVTNGEATRGMAQLCGDRARNDRSIRQAHPVEGLGADFDHGSDLLTGHFCSVVLL